MSIVANTVDWHVRFNPDYVADTLAELESALASYVGAYVRVLDQADQVYKVVYDNGVLKAVVVINEHHNLTPVNVDDVNVYIQDSAPTDTGKFLWIQTNYGGPDDFTFWFEDGT